MKKHDIIKLSSPTFEGVGIVIRASGTAISCRTLHQITERRPTDRFVFSTDDVNIKFEILPKEDYPEMLL